jgi:hypothetical protein
LWYKLAEANGLTLGSALIAGRTLSVPGGVSSTHHNADTFKPYDAAETLGNTQPGAPNISSPAPPRKKGCGVFGQIISTIVAVAASYFLGPVLGNVVSQGFNNIIGTQSGFSWKSLAISVVSAGVTQGVGSALGQGAIAGSQFVGDVVRGATSSAITQGISVGLKLQDKFSWTGIATAGLAAGVGGAVTRGLSQGRGSYAKNGSWEWDINPATGKAFTASFGAEAVGSAAGAIAGAAARSLIKGQNFGDTLISSLPEIIGSTAGNALARGIGGGNIWNKIFGEGSTKSAILNGGAPWIAQGVGAVVGAAKDGVESIDRNIRADNIIKQNGFSADHRALIKAELRAGRSSRDIVTAEYQEIANRLRGPIEGDVLYDGVNRPDAGFADLNNLDRFGVSLTQRGGSNPRARMGGNGGPPMYELRELRQVYGPITQTPAGPIIGLIDNLFDLSGPALRLTNDLYVAERSRLVDEIRSINPNARFDDAKPPSGYSREGQVNDIKHLLFTRAATYYNFRNDDSLLKVETLRQYQGFVNQGYREALAAEASGQLKIPNGWSREQALGTYTDSVARRETRGLFNRYGVRFGPTQHVSVNNRDYAPDNSYRIPDVRIGSFILDGTLSAKGYSTPQIKGYFQSQPGGTVANVRPAAKGPTYFLKAPR